MKGNLSACRNFLLPLLLAVPISTVQSIGPDVPPLLETTWKQRDAYALFTPNRERLGCWSVAFAQILFHHRLLPAGKTGYKGRNFTVSADFDNPGIRLENIVGKIGESTSDISRKETARFLWYMALIAGKDFGTGNYIGNSDVRRSRLEKHCSVKTARLRYPESTATEVLSFIASELEKSRPLLLYVEGNEPGTEGFGHALVIDGIREFGTAAKVHMNFGWEGVSDGWYPLFDPIRTEFGLFDKPDRWVMAIRPVQ